MSLEEKIKRWVALDNHHKKYNEQLKKIREEKTEINTDVINHFSEKNIKPPNINISDGRLSFVELTQANVISYKFLEDCFKEYFEDDEAADLLKFIKSKRTFSKVKSIRRVYNKE